MVFWTESVTMIFSILSISYYGNPVDRNVVVAETDYGLRFASVVACGNVWGTQFHPEKSGKPGEVVLRNFAEIIKK